MPFGLPQIKALKEEFGLENTQLREVRKIYAEHGDRLQAAAEKMKAANDEQKKELRREIAPLRKEILGKIAALFTPEQKTKWDAAMEKKRAEAKKRREQQPQQ